MSFRAVKVCTGFGSEMGDKGREGKGKEGRKEGGEGEGVGALSEDSFLELLIWWVEEEEKTGRGWWRLNWGHLFFFFSFN